MQRGNYLGWETIWFSPLNDWVYSIRILGTYFKQNKLQKDKNVYKVIFYFPKQNNFVYSNC